MYRRKRSGKIRIRSLWIVFVSMDVGSIAGPLSICTSLSDRLDRNIRSASIAGQSFGENHKLYAHTDKLVKEPVECLALRREECAGSQMSNCINCSLIARDDRNPQYLS